MADDPFGTDARLVAAARLGDATAFDALVRRYIRPAYALAFSIVRDHLDAEDICQDVFARALARLEECRAPERFAGWLFAIARSTALNFKRREQRRRGEPLEHVTAASSDSPLRDAERSELRSRLAAALARLDPPESDVVLLHDLEGWAHREIAAALGISEVGSRQHLFVARRKLREALVDLQTERTDHD